MKIIKLTAENIKKLAVVEITPDGNVVQITGKNGQGKTSVLDSIWWALAGTKNIQAQPIRKGEKKARIRLDLGEVVVERKFTESGSTIAVETAEGARFPSPQKMLDALLGELSFDPLAFARMEPKEQLDELRRISKIDVDIDNLDALNVGDFAKRTEINRDAKAKRAQADGIVVPPGDDAAEPIDESSLVDSLQQAGEINTELETRKSRREQAREQAETLKTSAAATRDRAAKLRLDADAALKHAMQQADTDEKTADEAFAKAADIEKKISDAPALPEPVDVSAIRQQIEQARATNKRINERAQAVERLAQVIAAAAELEAQSSGLTSKMEARKKEKADAIARAQMPIDGIGFGDGAVTYNGVPFDQASSSEQLRVSLSIAMAANPKLRVIRIQDGSLLDDDSMEQIAAMANEGDYQVWIERVDGSGKVGFVLEDGHIKQAAEKDAA